MVHPQRSAQQVLISARERGGLPDFKGELLALLKIWLLSVAIRQPGAKRHDSNKEP